MTGAGELHFRVTVLRREAITNVAGNERGNFIEWFSTRGRFTQLSATQTALIGQTQDAIVGTLTIRDRPEIDQLTNAERVVVNGSEFSIDSVPLKDLTGFRDIRIRRVIGE